MRFFTVFFTFIFFAPFAATAAPIEITSLPLVAPTTPLPPSGRLTYRHGVQLLSKDGDFGGFSALHMGRNTFIALTDKGRWLSAHFDAKTLTLSKAQLRRLRGTDGEPLRKKENGDAESITLNQDGSFLVGFERDHRIWRYSTLKSIPTGVYFPEAIAHLPANKGIEAMTRLPDGRLLLLAEGDEKTALGWIGETTNWNTFRYRLSDGFHPTAAAILPSGTIMILERRYSLLNGAAGRLRELAPELIKPGSSVDGVTVGLLELPLPVDNFEGMSIGFGQSGEILIYLLSDDNYSALQRTLLLVLELHAQ